MPKKRERSDTEYYKSIIRQLRKQVKTLRKQLQQAQNNYSPDIEDYDEEEHQEPTAKIEMCPACKKHPVRDFEVLDRKFKICEGCAWRSLPERTVKK